MNRSHRVRNQEQGRLSPRSSHDPRLCSFLAVFQPFSSRIDLAPWSDQDSVAERIAPLLGMLTVSV
jgi:hypothetical protein